MKKVFGTYASSLNHIILSAMSFKHSGQNTKRNVHRKKVSKRNYSAGTHITQKAIGSP